MVESNNIFNNLLQVASDVIHEAKNEAKAGKPGIILGITIGAAVGILTQQAMMRVQPNDQEERNQVDDGLMPFNPNAMQRFGITRREVIDAGIAIIQRVFQLTARRALAIQSYTDLLQSLPINEKLKQDIKKINTFCRAVHIASAIIVEARLDGALVNVSNPSRVLPTVMKAVFNASNQMVLALAKAGAARMMVEVLPKKILLSICQSLIAKARAAF
jgi:hypothetical protein